MDKKRTVIRMTPGEYAQITGYSEGYVRKYILKNKKNTMVEIRIATADLMEDIYEIRGTGNES